MNKFLLLIVLLIFIITVLYACYEDPPVVSLENKPPKTYVFLQPDSGSTISEQQSSIRLHWWGDDPDGLVVGYNISIDGINWAFTTSNDSLISFPISGADTIYIFRVAAIDDLGAVDPDPASIVLPLKNSAPVVRFLADANNNTIAIPETTFTVASFGWIATDLDGDQTISNIIVALNDTSQKISLPGNTRFITIKAVPPFTSDVVEAEIFIGSSNTPYHTKLPDFKLNSENILYVSAEDIAGSTSEIIRMPSATAEKKWFVKKPKGEILVIDDYVTNDNATSFYNMMFDSLGLSDKVDIWDIKLGKTASTPSLLLPKILSPMFTETLKLFKYIFWYTDNDPTLEPAQISINNFLNNGGKILFSMVFPQTFDARGLSDFLPVDSLSSAPISILNAGVGINPTNQGISFGYLQLRMESQAARIRTYFPNPFSAVNLYTLELNDNPVIGFKSTDSKIIYMGIPLHRANGDPFNVKGFFEKVFFGEFGVAP